MAAAHRRSSRLQNKSLDTDRKKILPKIVPPSCWLFVTTELQRRMMKCLERLQTLQLKEKGKWEALLCLKTRRSVFHFSSFLNLKWEGLRDKIGPLFSSSSSCAWNSRYTLALVIFSFCTNTWLVLDVLFLHVYEKRIMTWTDLAWSNNLHNKH